MCKKYITPDKSEAERHLRFLDSLASSFTFQTFDDNADRKDPKLACVLNGSLDEHWDMLVELSKRGAGVFVTVNETDGRGRKKENITGIRAIWQEDDGDGKTLPIEPSFTVMTSPDHYHRYILVKDYDDEL